MNQRLHMRDLGFGTIVVLVCSLGSLYLTEPTMSNIDRQKLAWKWYNQVELCGHSLRHPPTLYDIQAYCAGFPTIPDVLILSVLLIARCSVSSLYFKPSLCLVSRWIRIAAGARSWPPSPQVQGAD
jgi:hypothetical protein